MENGTEFHVSTDHCSSDYELKREEKVFPHYYTNLNMIISFKKSGLFFSLTYIFTEAFPDIQFNLKNK